MTWARRITGIAALVGIAAGINFLAVQEDVFSPVVVVPFLVGVAAGIIWVALVLTDIARTASQQRTLYGLNTVIASVVFLAICITLYAFARQWDVYADLTQEGRRELSPITVQVLQNLDEEVEVLCFFLATDDRLVDMGRSNTRRFLDRLEAHTDHLNVEFLDPQVDRARLQGAGLQQVAPQGTMVIRRGNRRRVLNLDSANARVAERDFTNALINVVRDRRPKLYFLTGMDERDITDQSERGFSALRVMLEGEGYEVDQLELDLMAPEIPDDAEVIVINGPRRDLNARYVDPLRNYVEQGGRVLVMLDPWQRPPTAMGQEERLRPWLADQFGVQLGEGLVFSEDTQTQILLSHDSTPFTTEQDAAGEFMGCYNYEHDITRGFNQQMIFVLARPAYPTQHRPDRVTRSELIRTPPSFWGEKNVSRVLETGQARMDSDDLEGPVPLAMAATRQTDIEIGDTGQTRDARAVVIGSTEFASNTMLRQITSHQNFILNTMAWLTESEELIAMRPASSRAEAIILTSGQEQFIAWLATLGLLQICVAAGAATYLVRRKYQ
ncbi:MAG: GldG family protein [Candidatus Hydrogenedentota bacterium]